MHKKSLQFSDGCFQLPAGHCNEIKLKCDYPHWRNNSLLVKILVSYQLHHLFIWWRGWPHVFFSSDDERVIPWSMSHPFLMSIQLQSMNIHNVFTDDTPSDSTDYWKFYANIYSKASNELRVHTFFSCFIFINSHISANDPLSSISCCIQT